MKSANLGIYYLDELSEIYFDNTLNIVEKYSKLRELLDKISKELTKNEVVNFSNLFFTKKLCQTCQKIQKVLLAFVAVSIYMKKCSNNKLSKKM